MQRIKINSLKRNFFQRRNFFMFVDSQEVAYKEFLGQKREKLKTGINFYIPLFVKIKKIMVCERELELTFFSFTKDFYPIKISISLFFKIQNPEKALYSFENYERILYFSFVSTVRNLTGKFNYLEIAKGNDINIQIKNDMTEKLRNMDIDFTRCEMQYFELQNNIHSQKLCNEISEKINFEKNK